MSLMSSFQLISLFDAANSVAEEIPNATQLSAFEQIVNVLCFFSCLWTYGANTNGREHVRTQLRLEDFEEEQIANITTCVFDTRLFFTSFTSPLNFIPSTFFFSLLFMVYVLDGRF